MLDEQRASMTHRLAGTRYRLLVILLVALWAASFASPRAAAQDGPPAAQVVEELQHDESPPLAESVATTPGRPGEEPPRVVPHLHPKPERPPEPPPHDPGLQTFAHGRGKHRRSAFPGVGANGYAPPDTNGAAGLTQFVQWVNVQYAVYNKTTGQRVLGPAAGNTFWKGFGGPCESNNDGDPIAQFDKAAGRWVMAQPVYSSPFMYCVAVSTTGDATGTYYRYAFPIPGDVFPDYPKLGVWPDGYYVSFNAFDASGNNFLGALACALDRNAMLAGGTASAICFQQGPAVDSLLPSDLDGSTPPPAGSSNYFAHFIPNALDLYQFHADFASPSNSTFTGPTTLLVNAFSEACGGGSCIPQGGTGQRLDSLGDRLMYRFAYRNFGDHEALVVNHSVAAGTSVGVRWYELRQTPPGNGGFDLYQQGTFAPDAQYRWMGSIAMDRAGNIALGYSLSSGSTHPSIAYTVHVPGTDAPGTMQAETVVLTGAGSQTGGLDRWGDYSSMSVDPADDCTLWYTNEYLPANGAFNWSTYITSFALPSCTQGAPTPDFAISATPSTQTVLPGGSTSYTVTVSALNGFAGSVGLSQSGLPSGAGASFAPATVNGSGQSTLTVTTTSATPTGTFTITITGTSGTSSHSTTVALTVNPPPDFSVSATPASRTVNRGSSTTYTVTVSKQDGFAGVVSFGASGLGTGASASFSPASVSGSGSSTLTVTTTSTAQAGTFTVTITGTSGATSHSTTVALTVNGTDFSIAASPGAQTIQQGQATTYTVTVSPVNGFAGSLTFSASGQGTGTSVKFNPSSVTGAGSATMTVTASSTAKVGTFTLTIKGTSGGLTRSTTVSLTINPGPNFLITASPAAQTVTRGSSATYTVTVTGCCGFVGTVTFSVSGLPSGATAAFAPPSVAGGGTSTLTVSTTAQTATGTKSLTIKGTSGGLNHSTRVNLTVN
jgi:hypothetical protein